MIRDVIHNTTTVDGFEIDSTVKISECKPILRDTGNGYFNPNLSGTINLYVSTVKGLETKEVTMPKTMEEQEQLYSWFIEIGKKASFTDVFRKMGELVLFPYIPAERFTVKF
jgi:hypothetical protein